MQRRIEHPQRKQKNKGFPGKQCQKNNSLKEQDQQREGETSQIPKLLKESATINEVEIFFQEDKLSQPLLEGVSIDNIVQRELRELKDQVKNELINPFLQYVVLDQELRYKNEGALAHITSTFQDLINNTLLVFQKTHESHPFLQEIIRLKNDLSHNTLDKIQSCVNGKREELNTAVIVNKLAEQLDNFNHAISSNHGTSLLKTQSKIGFPLLIPLKKAQILKKQKTKSSFSSVVNNRQKRKP